MIFTYATFDFCMHNWGNFGTAKSPEGPKEEHEELLHNSIHTGLEGLWPFIVIPLILFLFRPDEFELILVCTKWTSSFGCFEIVSAINGLIRLFDTSSPFITPGQWFMPSNWQWVVINFVALKKIQHTHYLGWKLIPLTQRVHSEQFLIFLVGNSRAKKKVIKMITTSVNCVKFEVNKLPKVFENCQKLQKSQ